MKRLDLSVTAVGLAVLPLLGLLTAEEAARLQAPVLLSALALLAALEPRLVPGERAWKAADLAALLFFLYEALFRSTPILFCSVHLLLYLLVNRFHHRHRLRGQQQLLLISFLTLLAITVLAVEVVVFVYLLAWLAAALAHLNALHWAQTRAAGGMGWGDDRISAPLIGACGLLTLGGAVVVFVLVPRVGAGTIQVPVRSPQHVTGFAPEVSLADIGRIKTSDSVTMRLRHLSGPRPHGRLLIRGVAFQHWDGERWSRAGRSRHLLPERGSRYRLKPSPSGPETQFELRLEPGLSGVLFAPSRPTGLRVSKRWGLVHQDGSGALYFEYMPRRRRVYQVWSELGGTELGAGAAPLADQPIPIESFTQLPGSLDPRIRRLAQTVSAEGGSTLEIAHRLSGYLQTEFAYSLDLGEGGGQDPLSAFLFQRRSGHCELFASALTVMLRTIDVPARVVNGFVASEHNGTGDYYLVRARDAHAWVEVLADQGRWVVFDPTPAEPPLSGPWWAPQRLAVALDALRLSWDRWVVSFSRDDQQELLVRVSALGAGLAQWLRRSIGSVLNALPGGLSRLGAVLLVLGLLLPVWLALLRRRRAAGHGPQALRAYQRMLLMLRKHGRSKAEATTPLEFASGLRSELPEVNEITALHQVSRYAQREPPVEQAVRLQELLTALNRRLRGGPPAASGS